MPLVYLNNVVPPVIFAVDMLFNKLLFRYKHLVLVLFAVGFYYGIIVLRTVLLPDQPFPGVQLHKSSDYKVLGYGALGMVAAHLVFTTITVFRYKVLKKKEWGQCFKEQPKLEKALYHAPPRQEEEQKDKIKINLSGET